MKEINSKQGQSKIIPELLIYVTSHKDLSFFTANFLFPNRNSLQLYAYFTAL